MDTPHKTSASWAIEAAVLQDSKQRALLPGVGKKPGKVNVGFFFRCQQTTDEVLPSYFHQCALNQNVYLLHLYNGLMRNRTEEVEKSTAHYSMSLKLLWHTYTHSLRLTSPPTAPCCHHGVSAVEQEQPQAAHYQLIQYHELCFRNTWNPRGVDDCLYFQMKAQTDPDDPQSV